MKKLNCAQKQIFAMCFYDQWAKEFTGIKPDTDTPTPWGMPWLHGHCEDYTIGDSIEDMASNWFDIVRHDIICLIDEGEYYEN